MSLTNTLLSIIAGELLTIGLMLALMLGKR